MIFSAIGKGNATAGCNFLIALENRLHHARKKHSNFRRSDKGALEALKSEVEEVEKSLQSETEERKRDELLDVIVVATRWYMGEQK